LPGKQNELIKTDLSANPNAIVVLQTGGPVEMPCVDRTPANLQLGTPR
jgi:beta-glucosidase